MSYISKDDIRKFYNEKQLTDRVLITDLGSVSVKKNINTLVSIKCIIIRIIFFLI